ncbi:MAG: LytR C-terminal domain-containing protein [Microbacteriaceae bacterium]
MAEKFLPDRFDELPSHPARVGAHRAGPAKYRRLKYVGWSLLAVVVLSAVGIGSVVAIDNGIFSSADDASSVLNPTVTPTIDPSVPITVLNGTPTDTLDESVADELTQAGFTIGSSTNADKQDVRQSIVYYSSAQYQAVAQGVANALGISTVKQSTSFDAIGSSVTVVLGTDFVPSAVG